MAPDWLTIGALVLVALTAFVTVLVAALIWRSGYKRGWRTARSAPPACPQCGYVLSGLSTCRCPECGTSYSLDALWSRPILAKRFDRNAEFDDRPKVGTQGAETT